MTLTTTPADGAPSNPPAPPAGPTPSGQLALTDVGAAASLPAPTPDHGCAFTVYGIPVTQAGMRAVPTPAGYRQVTTGGKGLLPWRQAVARGAQAVVDERGAFGDSPVVVSLDFRFPMPKARTKTQRRGGVWFHTGRRDDIDKLERAILDGLVAGGLIADDGNVVEVHKRKREYSSGWVGVEISIWPADLMERPL